MEKAFSGHDKGPNRQTGAEARLAGGVTNSAEIRGIVSGTRIKPEMGESPAHGVQPEIVNCGKFVAIMRQGRCEFPGLMIG